LDYRIAAAVVVVVNVAEHTNVRCNCGAEKKKGKRRMMLPAGAIVASKDARGVVLVFYVRAHGSAARFRVRSITSVVGDAREKRV